MQNTEAVKRLIDALDGAEAVVIGSGAGLSTAAGFTYAGARFERYFADFARKYGFLDMYSGGFYPFETSEEYWAYWSRYIYINRYVPGDNGVYRELVRLFSARESFVISTNTDSQWRLAGWDERRLFCTQGDYGLFQCSKPCHHNTYCNEETIRRMVLSQGYAIDESGGLIPPENGAPLMRVPSELLPRCPVCHRPMRMNLREDDTFVQDNAWYDAAKRYRDFLDRHRRGRMVYLELGVGYNTPVIIKYPFWRRTYENLKATYVCINRGEASAPREIAKRSICIDGDIRAVLDALSREQGGNHSG